MNNSDSLIYPYAYYLSLKDDESDLKIKLTVYE